MSKERVEFYHALCRLAGNVLNEVPIRFAPAPEIIMLQHIHGEDAITNLTKVSAKEIPPVFVVDIEEANATESEGWSDRVIRAYLRRKYSSWQDPEDKVVKVFGSNMVPLPKYLDMEVAAAKQSNEDRLREQIERDVRAKLEKEFAEKQAAIGKTPAELARMEADKAAQLSKALE